MNPPDQGCRLGLETVPHAIFAVPTRSGTELTSCCPGGPEFPACRRCCYTAPFRNETSHTSPKCKRGNDLKASLTLRVSVPGRRGQYKLERPI